MNEQINQESADSVETPRTAQDVFTEMLDAEESNDKPEATNEEQENIEENAEEAEEETESESEVEELEEDNPETEEDEDDESEDEEVEVEDEPVTYTVKSGGEEKEVTVEDLISGYQKGDDYTKKSQALAEQRKAVEAEAHAVQEAMQLREQYAQRLDQVKVLLENSDEQVDLDELKENDPITWSIKVAEKTENNKKLNLIQQEQNRLAQAHQKQVSEQQAKLVAHEAEMLTSKVKEFSDPKKAEQIKGEIRNFGKSIGFSDQELAQVYDHRHVMVLQKAMAYDRIQKAKAGVTKKVAKAPKMAKQGNKVAKTDLFTKQKKRLKQSGSLADATEVFKNFL